MPKYSEKTSQELLDLVGRLINNKETRRETQRLIQKVDPSVEFTALDVDDLREEIRQDRESEKIERERDEALRRLAAQRRKVAARFTKDDGTVDEQHMSAIDDIVKSGKTYDYEVAATYYAAKNPPPEPRPQPQLGAQFWQAPKFDGLFENPMRWSRDQINQHFTERDQRKH